MKYMYFYGKNKKKKKRKTELLEISLPEKFRHFLKITEIFPSTKVIEAHLTVFSKMVNTVSMKCMLQKKNHDLSAVDIVFIEMILH